ncbi:ABC transporter ATP-binding protein [Cronbergia sp. UHCC 0137]|uniref:ABC transporter ATP-binding protein n=1 Tax=Cronbergia sp. UHCC 0137 TaxID=3110239 RepID=UPI002B21C6D2|nr:ABC transporter ATP-binding protein [Cronbergia sp. UHCC 0137]MEA5617125.1 ABC transporter ATP-binding protein [Cronbergia sp. UHCC 0137]
MESTKNNQKETGLWETVKPVQGRIIAAMSLSVLNTITTLVALLTIPVIVRELLSTNINTQFLWLLITASAIATVITFISRTWAFRISHIAAFKLEEIIRTQIAEHLARLPLGYVVTTGSGTIKKIVQDDVKELHAFVADSTPFIARAYSAPLITLIVLFVVDWRMTLATLAPAPIGLIFMRLAMRDHAKERQAYDEANEKINGTVIEFVQGMQVVRTFDDGTTSFIRYSKSLDDFTQRVKAWTDKTQLAGRLGFLIMASLPTLLAVVTVGTWLMIQGTLDFPTFILFLLLSSGVMEALLPIMWLSQFINKSAAAAKRIAKVLAETPLPEPEHPQQPSDTSVRFRNVTFSYGETHRLALKDVNLCIKAGTVTALVGPSGAGKSTVAKLIPRFWDVDAGTVEIGGVDVRKMTTDTLMSQVSFVFQDTFLLYDTIAANIRLGRSDATDAEVEAAAKAAQAHDFILELPQGYDTIAGERGTRLSGGQKQRITIARAILQDNPIVILDEATAFADPENEALIQQAIASLTVGKTLVIIAHRLSTIINADQILVLDGGRIVESGTHQELVNANGLYTRLWDNHRNAQNWGLRNSQLQITSK